MTTNVTADNVTADWDSWHETREFAVAKPHGIAALTTTSWLDERPTIIDGLPGEWAVIDGRVVSGAAAQPISLSPGDEVALGQLLLRVIERDGVLALRVYDPAAPRRVALRGISTFPHDAAWTVIGKFEPAAEDAQIRITHVDGAISDDTLAGTVRFTVAGHEAAVAAFPVADGLQVTFADTSNGSGTQQFRFLALPTPDADGRVQVDLNRAYLPPCAFSDHYLCPLPPAQNRLPFAVTAGEAFAIIG